MCSIPGFLSIGQTAISSFSPHLPPLNLFFSPTPPRPVSHRFVFRPGAYTSLIFRSTASGSSSTSSALLGAVFLTETMNIDEIRCHVDKIKADRAKLPLPQPTLFFPWPVEG